MLETRSSMAETKTTLYDEDIQVDEGKDKMKRMNQTETTQRDQEKTE